MLQQFLHSLSRRRIIPILACGSTIVVLLFLWRSLLIFDNCHHIFSENLEYGVIPIEDKSNSLQPTPASPAANQQTREPQKSVYHIHINLDAMQLYLYKNGVLVKTYPCSGGTLLTPSPEGTWKIISKDTWGEGFGGSWMGLDVPWGEYGIHGTSQPWLVGRVNASHGCIRMRSEDAAELYRIVPHGTTVAIVQTHKPFRVMIAGDIGSDVRDLQQALHSLGYYSGAINGVYSGALSLGVHKFQKDHRLEPTGKTDRRTFDLITQKVKELE